MSEINETVEVEIEEAEETVEVEEVEETEAAEEVEEVVADEEDAAEDAE